MFSGPPPPAVTRLEIVDVVVGKHSRAATSSSEGLEEQINGNLQMVEMLSSNMPSSCQQPVCNTVLITRLAKCGTILMVVP